MLRLKAFLILGGFLFGMSGAVSLAESLPPRYPGIESLENCRGGVFAPVYGSDFCSLAAYLLQNISPLQNPVEVLSAEPVVLLGDTHPNKLLKRWLARNLGHFKSAGFTHVGLEALNSESQALIDRYKKDPSLKEEVLQLIATDWNWIPEEHLALIDAVHQSGLELVALDNRNELEKRGLADRIQLRNEHMAEIIQSTITHPRAGRMLVLTGKVHSALNSDEEGERTLPEVLNTQKIPVLSFDLESDELRVPRMMTQAFKQYLSQGMLPGSVSGDYYLPTPRGASCHGVIFITR